MEQVQKREESKSPPIEYETLKIQIPKILTPIIDTMCYLTGHDQITFLERFVYHGLAQILREPHYLFEYYTDFENSEFFNTLKTGLDQFSPDIQS